MGRQANNVTKSNTKTVPESVTSKIDWANVRRLRNAGKTWKEIAQPVGYSPAYLKKEFCKIKHISPLITNPEATEDYKTNRADIYADTGRRLLEGVTEDKIKKARVGELILAHAQISDKERMERNPQLNTEGNLIVILNRIDARGIPEGNRF